MCIDRLRGNKKNVMGHALDNQSLCCTSEIVVGSTELPAVFLSSPPGLEPTKPIPIIFQGEKVC